ncbi:hypothetical protein KKH56_03665 [bacterium]|nr:hypothetical protein [bacterium]
MEIRFLKIAQVELDEAVDYYRTKPASLSIPVELAARVAFLAQLHRKTSVEEWLMHIIQERVEIEEAAYVGVNHDLAAKVG